MNSPTVGGAAGPIATWNESSILPRCIGYELESRYNKPKKVSRTSTTNLVLRKDVLEMIGGFDEDLPTGYDGDIGYRITSKGYMIAFAPEAKVYHFHRPTFTSFLKQQYNYARNDLTLYSKHPGLAKGDNVTSKWMIAQPILIAASLASLIFGAIVALATGLAVRPASSVLFVASAALALLLIGSYAVNSLTLALRAKDLTAWPVLFCILSGRALAWTIGGGMGLLGYVRRNR